MVYLRVSEEDSAQKKGLDVQEKVISGYLERKGYSVVATLKDDGVSGATRWQDRRGLKRAFTLCVRGEADVIVAYHQDRFARKMGVFEDIRDYALAKHIRLETADSRVLTQRDDFLNGDVQAFVAALERRRISERFYAARCFRSATDGCGSGPLPYGYRRDEADTLTIDEEAAAAIRRLFALRSCGVSYQKTANTLTAEGHVTASGKNWTPASVQSVERHEDLYRTGRRAWDTVVSALVWPIILHPAPSSESPQQ